MKKAIVAFLVTAAILHAAMLTLGFYSLIGSRIYAKMTAKPSVGGFAIAKDEKAIAIAKVNNPSITPEKIIKDLSGDIHIIGWNSMLASFVGEKYDWVFLIKTEEEKFEKQLGKLVNNIKLFSSYQIDENKNLRENFEQIPNKTYLRKKGKEALRLAELIIKSKNELIKKEKNASLRESINKLQDNLEKFRKLINPYKFYYDGNLYYVYFSYNDVETRIKNLISGYYFEVDVKNSICRNISDDNVLRRKYRLDAVVSKDEKTIQSIIEELKK